MPGNEHAFLLCSSLKLIRSWAGFEVCLLLLPSVPHTPQILAAILCVRVGGDGPEGCLLCPPLDFDFSLYVGPQRELVTC